MVDNPYKDMEQDYFVPPALSPPPHSLSSPVPHTPDGVNIDAPNIPDLNLRWVEDYPGEVGSIYGTCETTFVTFRKKQEAAGHQLWAPFSNQAEWELAEWLMTAGISQGKIDLFLKLESICEGAKPAFHNARSLLKQIDALPSGSDWICDGFELTGNELDANGKPRTEWVEVWRRDPVKCAQMLVKTPTSEKTML
ncbi:hypothetical protein C0991_004977 [Blastosporella zonata]|nr:hypothetical protein C0991_004977 [Blastosporella zonata]